MTKADTYTEGIGRRKTATARVRITVAKQNAVVVNDNKLADYFVLPDAQAIVLAPLQNAGEKFSVTVQTSGGGMKAQAEAVRHGLARALIKYNATLRKDMKALGFLRRDPRAKERKKFGLKAARRAPQWSKR